MASIKLRYTISLFQPRLCVHSAFKSGRKPWCSIYRRNFYFQLTRVSTCAYALDFHKCSNIRKWLIIGSSGLEFLVPCQNKVSLQCLSNLCDDKWCCCWLSSYHLPSHSTCTQISYVASRLPTEWNDNNKTSFNFLLPGGQCDKFCKLLTNNV